jgi:hypothetical protein
LRLPWAIAGFVALLLIGVTIGLVSNYNSDKAAANEVLKVAAKDAGLTGAPADAPTQTTPGDFKVGAPVDASVAEKETSAALVKAESKQGVPLVKAPAKVSGRRTNTGSNPVGSKTLTPNQAAPNQSLDLQSTEQKNLESKGAVQQNVSPKTLKDSPQSRAQRTIPN